MQPAHGDALDRLWTAHDGLGRQGESGGPWFARRLHGERVAYPRYETLEVEDVGGLDLEFRNPTGVRRGPGTLTVFDEREQLSYACADVEALTVWDDAPDRPWIVAATAGAMLLGGVIGARPWEPCPEGSDFCGVGRGAAALAGITIGLGLGLAISIPATAPLQPETLER